MSIKKIFGLLRYVLRGQVVIDYPMLTIGRERHFRVPKVTNYIRINTFELIVDELKRNRVEGNVAELGVYKGEFAKYINSAFPNKKLYLFDTFEGFDSKDVLLETKNQYSEGTQDFSDTSIKEVLGKMISPGNCIIKKGYFPDSLEGLEDEFCFVSLDADLYLPILEGLNYFYPRLRQGGYIFIHDYNNSEYGGAKEAVRQFCQTKKIGFVPISDSWGTVIISK